MLKRLRTILLAAVASAALFAAVVFSACNKPSEPQNDPCAEKTCLNNGTCIDGSCSCTAGFTGEQCQVKVADRYLGKWEMSQKVESSPDSTSLGQSKTYVVTIKQRSGSAVLLEMEGILGDNNYTAVLRISMAPGYITVDSVQVDSDLPARPDDFIFERYQSIAGTEYNIKKGHGSVTETANKLTGEFYLTRPHPQKGLIEERISFNAVFKP